MKRTPFGIEETYPGCDYSDAEREFLVAVDRFKRLHRRLFLSCRELLAIILSLGYRQSPSDRESP